MDSIPNDIDLEKKIDAYIKRRLTEEEAEQLWVELLKDPGSIDLLETELYIKSIIERRAGKDAAPVRAVSSGVFRKWVAAAAAAVILAAALYLVRSGRNSTVPFEALPRINLAEHLVSPVVVRSPAEQLSGTDSLLAEGLAAALAGRTDRASALYNRIITGNSSGRAAAQAYFNTGILRYNAGLFKDAVAAFDSALQMAAGEPVLEEKTHWFSGHALIRLNRYEEAREAIRNTYVADGIYREEAARLLEKLDQATVNGK